MAAGTGGTDGNPLVLTLLVVPALVIVLMFKQKGLVFSMVIGNCVGIIMSMTLGFISPNDIITAEGLIPAGFEGMDRMEKALAELK